MRMQQHSKCFTNVQLHNSHAMRKSVLQALFWIEMRIIWNFHLNWIVMENEGTMEMASRLDPNGGNGTKYKAITNPTPVQIWSRFTRLPAKFPLINNPLCLKPAAKTAQPNQNIYRAIENAKNNTLVHVSNTQHTVKREERNRDETTAEIPNIAICLISLIARFMGPTWGPPGAERTQVGPMLASWSLLYGLFL